MRILTVTNMFPTKRDPAYGIFVKEQVDSIRELGHDVDVLFLNTKEGRLRHKGYILGVPRLWQVLAHRRYDVIHAHYVFTGIIARLQRAAPLVLTHHGCELRDPFQGSLCRWTRDWPEELIVVADWMYRELGAPRAHVIPCGIDSDVFAPMDRLEARKRLGLDPDRRYVLFAGQSWNPIKRFPLIQEAVAKVSATNPDVELLVVDGKPHDVIPLYMNAADVLTLVSINEGSAQVIKEAMACNLPIVASDAGDSWEVIADTPGCYRTSPEIEEIAARIEQAISPPRRTEGRSRVQSFGMTATAEAVASVYQEALASRRRGLHVSQTRGSEVLSEL